MCTVHRRRVRERANDVHKVGWGCWVLVKHFKDGSHVQLGPKPRGGRGANVLCSGGGSSHSRSLHLLRQLQGMQMLVVLWAGKGLHATDRPQGTKMIIMARPGHLGPRSAARPRQRGSQHARTLKSERDTGGAWPAHTETGVEPVGRSLSLNRKPSRRVRVTVSSTHTWLQKSGDVRRGSRCSTSLPPSQWLCRKHKHNQCLWRKHNHNYWHTVMHRMLYTSALW